MAERTAMYAQPREIGLTALLLAEQIRVNRRTIMRWLVRIGYAPPSTFVTYVSMRFRSDGERSINATPMHNLSIM